MKLYSIKTLKKYKSFQNFFWHSFFNSEKFHEKTNILYGENGCGKSSICNILKNVSQNKDFVKYSPKEICLDFDNGDYVYANGDWDKHINKDNFLFFDRDFVDKNIHLGHDRGKQQGQQEQESGKMIIEFDSEAIKLRLIRDKAKEDKEVKELEIKKFNEDNTAILSFMLTEEEKKLYDKFKDNIDEDIQAIKKELKENKNIKDKKLEEDQEAQKKVLSIQNDIKEIEFVEAEISLSEYNKYQSLFDFDMKEKTKIESEQSLIEKIKQNKDFFERGFSIRKESPDICPFCQTQSEELNIKKILNLYNQIYDDSYKVQYEMFLKEKQIYINELITITRLVDSFDPNIMFFHLKKLDQNYKIKNIYAVEEEENYKKPKTAVIQTLIDVIAKLEKPNKENIKTIYDEVNTNFIAIKKFLSDINTYILEKNKIIKEFKLENTDEKLKTRISEYGIEVGKLNKEIEFFDGCKIDSQKKKEQKVKELKLLDVELEALKIKYKDAREKYENYCSNEAFSNLLTKIELYFKNFNFSFSLKLDTERRQGSTKEYPFAFKILDRENNERDLKEGLSEGELQVLSLCFFFAFLDIQTNKDQKILVFDDPITSLDNGNLSCLVELIFMEEIKFSQTFIFTHHRTFFKFLKKRFDKKCHEYNIIRNRNEFGGSFICKSKSDKFIDKLSAFETHLQSIQPTSIDIELKIVEYGQYLRYEVERYIKNSLLHWDANNFSSAIDGLKKNRTISDSDLDKIKQVYSFCNWTTSHVDIGDDHGLEQLKTKINEFVDIIGRNSLSVPTVVNNQGASIAT